MTPDLSKLPDLPALKQLARALWHNGSIRGAALMAGAGFSKYAILQAPDTQAAPTWNELLDELIRQLYPTDQSSAPQDPLRIVEEYRTYFGQATLDGFIRTRFPDRAWLPGTLHLQALNFPWSDILTTNWDTLLERTADEVTDFTYEIVRTEADIAYARSPRIIKLHGTLGDKDPLIFASEDYRTYPARHAAFINLARQIFIENDLCLIGFSGNDPNFLEWAGWVRDQLGGQARRIYLVGHLALSVSARRYLEAHNIAPIDFAPLVVHVPKPERYMASTEIFLEILRGEQPPAPHEWHQHAFNEYPMSSGGHDAINKARDDDAFAAEALKETARLLRDDRDCYPGWLICPRQLRRGSPSAFGEWAIFRPSVLALFKSSDLVEIFKEFLWRYTTGFCALPDHFRSALVIIMDEPNPPIERSARLRFAVALMRDTRIKGNYGDFEKWSTIFNAEAEADSPERLDMLYQQCLRLRDCLDLASLTKSIKLLDSDNPLWRLRQAGLYAEIGEYATATKLIKDATAEFERAYRLNRHSIWIKSCLAWASWLNRHANMASIGRRNGLPQAREFQQIKIDPAGELEALENSAAELRRKDQEDDAAITPLFDAGSYRRGRAKAHARPGDLGFDYLYELDQLIECTGVPMRINHVRLAAGAATSILKVTYHCNVRWYLWLIRNLHSHFDNLFIRVFSRIAIAQMTPDVARQLRQKLDDAIVFWRNRITLSIAEEKGNDRSIAVDELRLMLSVQSHMTLRMTSDEAVEAFRIGVGIAGDPAASHRWVIEAAGELAKYALEAMPDNIRVSLGRDIILFPLATERGGDTPTWPDLISTVAEIKPHRDNQDLSWDQRIQQLLIAAVPTSDGRPEATERLAYLARHDVLKANERDSFALNLWNETDGDRHPLPAGTRLLTSTIASLPAPAGIDPVARTRSRIFERDIREAMDCTDTRDSGIISEKKNYLISLYNTGPLGLSMTAKRATEMFDQIIAWSPTPVATSDLFGGGFTQNFNDFVRVWSSDVLTFVVLAAMKREDKNETRLLGLLSFINITKAWRALAALPEFLETVPTLRDSVIRCINQGLSAAEHLRISGATTALVRWSAFVRTHNLENIPRSSIEQLLSAINSNQNESLFNLLEASVKLVSDGHLTNDDMVWLMHSLSDLKEGTKYANILVDSRRAVSISLVRQQCVRLAHLLQRNISDDGTLSQWLEEGRSDPLPEVRLTAQAL